MFENAFTNAYFVAPFSITPGRQLAFGAPSVIRGSRPAASHFRTMDAAQAVLNKAPAADLEKVGYRGVLLYVCMFVTVEFHFFGA